MRLAHYAVEIGAKPVGPARVDAVTGRALLEHALAASRVSCGELEFDRLGGVRAGFALGVGKRPAGLLGSLAVERLAAVDPCAEADDTGEQDPSGGGILTIVHETPAARSGKDIGVEKREWRCL